MTLRQYHISIVAAVLLAVLPVSAFAQSAKLGANSLNPSVSLTLEGQYADFGRDPHDYQLSGFTLVGEAAELGENGPSLGHSELVIAASVDHLFTGQMTLGIAEHEGEIELELEEAFVETLGLGVGFTLKMGRFLSGVGHHNERHAETWDFADAALIQRGLWGEVYYDDGVSVKWVAPTPVYLELATELLAGRGFVGGHGHEEGEDEAEEEEAEAPTINARMYRVRVGFDAGASHSFLFGASYHDVATLQRVIGDIEHHEGTSTTQGLSFVYKWSPDGNLAQRHINVIFEHFARDEDGALEMDPDVEGTVERELSGWYLQANWLFTRQWRVGARFEALSSSLGGTNTALLAASGYASGGHDPRKTSVVLDWLPSEFSRVRLQIARDESTQDVFTEVRLGYTFSIGAHGGHAY